MGAVETVIDVVTDNKKYYNCPRCGEEVWAYGSFVGNKCWDCPGTLVDATLRTGDMAVPVFSVTKDAIFDNKIEYRCQRCGVKKWAYGAGAGRLCWDCRGKGFAWSGDKYADWYQMSEACEVEKPLDSILESYYNDDGDEIEIAGKTFSNVISKSRLANSKKYHSVDWDYSCGCNAVNMCLKMWRGANSKQFTQSKLNSDAEDDDIGSKYIYQKVMGTECGCTGTEFYNKNVAPMFEYHGRSVCKAGLKDADVDWAFLHGTDFSQYSVILMGGDGVGHFTVVIGISEDRQYYLVTDQSLKVWVCDRSLMRKICTYGLTKSQGSIGLNLYNESSMYRVG